MKTNFKEISQFELPEESPGFLLWHVSTKWRSSIELVLKPFGLTHPQFVILAAIGWLTREGKSINQSAISKFSGSDQNTLSQIIKGLEKRDLVNREQAGRVKNSLLTTEGNVVLKKAILAVESVDREFFDHLNKRELKKIISSFKKLIENKNN